MDLHVKLIHQWLQLSWKSSHIAANKTPFQPQSKQRGRWKIPRLRIPVAKQQFYIGTGKYLEN